MRKLVLLAICSLVAFVASSRVFADDKQEAQYDALAESSKVDDAYDWTLLFDGTSLKNWIDNKDGGDDVVSVKDGAIVLGMGPTSTSIRYDVENSEFKIPRDSYELEFVSRRASGVDFFSALTFPIGENSVTFVNGGWGGTVAGISSIDNMDASENSSSCFYNFKTKQWYRFRVQVGKKVVRVWVNDEKIIDYAVEGHTLGTRFEMSKCEPLGFASWVSEGQIKVARIRALSDEELKEIDAKAESASHFIVP